jgi:hypothetical protein
MPLPQIACQMPARFGVAPMIVFALLLAAPLPPQYRTAFPGGDEGGTRTTTSQPNCDPTADEITVCGDHDQSHFRVAELGNRFEPKPLRPRFNLPGGGKGRVDAVQRGVGPGVSVPGAMVTLKIPFGKKPKKRQAE